jgi:hypothetical protein
VASHLGLTAALLLSAGGAIIGLLPASRLSVRPVLVT